MHNLPFSQNVKKVLLILTYFDSQIQFSPITIGLTSSVKVCQQLFTYGELTIEKKSSIFFLPSDF